MSLSGDSRHLLQLVQAGDSRAAAELHDRYLQRLIRLAQSRLSPQLRRRVAAEDVVQSAFRSFFVRAREGQFELQRSGDLWRLLAAITIKRVHRQLERHTAARRDVQLELHPNNLDLPVEAMAHEPSADIVAAIVEQVENVMQATDERTRRALQLRLQGYAIDEIAANLERSQRTVRRLLNNVRTRLEHEFYGDV